MIGDQPLEPLAIPLSGRTGGRMVHWNVVAGAVGPVGTPYTSAMMHIALSAFYEF